MVLHNLFFLVLAAAVYAALEPPPESRPALIAVLVGIYILAVLALELLIMPLYVYRPLRLLLDADEATQKGDHANELISDHLIPDDEIGQIMRSRNASIAQLRRKEQELANLLSRLDTAKKSLADQDHLASLGLLSASVAHELGSPLGVLHGSIEKLIETVPDGAAQQRLARMLRVTSRLRKISETLLDFAKPRTDHMASAPVREMVQEAWELLALDDKAAGVRFTNAVSASAMVIGNPDRLVQVFVNLLRNSLLAVKSTGVIQVRSETVGAGGRGWVEIAVEDDGAGIPPDVLPRIFDAFVTTRLDARGTGLGLAVAEAIVEEHGGEIQAANRQEGGARLTVRLPAARAQARETA